MRRATLGITGVNCPLCNQAPEACQCLDRLAAGSTPATVVEGTVKADPERSSAIWVREDPRSGLPFVTVVLEPGPKATVDDVRLAVGALVRWRNAVAAKFQRPFTEEAAAAAVLSAHLELEEMLGAGSRGIHVALAKEINGRLVDLLRDNANDLAIQNEAADRVSGSEEGSHQPSLDEAIRQIIIERYAAGDQEDARFHSFVGRTIAESYLRALGYSPVAATQICERACEDIALRREPFAPEYPADRRRVRELVRKALRKAANPAADRG